MSSKSKKRESQKIEDLESDIFIDQLKAEIQKGVGFVPFIGSGCSSASGIMMGLQFDSYLAYTVYRCIAPTGNRLDLRTEGWPKMPNPTELKESIKWIRNTFDQIFQEDLNPKYVENKIVQFRQRKPARNPESVAKALARPLIPRVLRSLHCIEDEDALKSLHRYFGPTGTAQGGYSRSGISPTSQDAIIERAIRSLYDWRATLNFLSEVKLYSGETLLLENPDGTIIDRFNVHITRGRKPNLFHNMLCHLAAPARFRIILTTNFDSLIEDTFGSLRESLSVISVGINGCLPDQDIVHSQNTLVKLHGDLSETRANFSLDESPALETKKTFFHYVRGINPDLSENKTFIPSHLLICGYSGQDNRCNEMIKYVLDADAQAKIYWICYNKSDLARLNRLFIERAYIDRIHAVVTDRSDLLLYELYQQLCLCLPPGGFSYQYTHNVPPANIRSKAALRLGEGRKSAHKALRRDWINTTNSRLQIAFGSGTPGVLAALRELTKQISEDLPSSSHIWLELEDYADTYCLAYDLLLIISIRRGLFQRTHGDLLPSSIIDQLEAVLIKPSVDNEKKGIEIWHKHLGLLASHYLNITPENWVIVIYGRNGAGGCSGWETSNYWESDGLDFKLHGRFATFVKTLCLLKFRVIYAPYTEVRRKDDLRKMAAAEDGSGGNPIDPDIECAIPPAQSCNDIENNFRAITSRVGKFEGYTDVCQYIDGDPRKLSFTFDTMLDDIKRHWIGPTGDMQKQEVSDGYHTRLRFLYNTTLFRQSRHYSAFLSDGVLRCPNRFNSKAIDNDWDRNALLHGTQNGQAQGFLQSLQSAGFFLGKPGGFAWTYRDFRLAVRSEICNNPQTASFEEHPATWRAYSHLYIADWYMRSYYSTSHAWPLVEALFHFRQSILHANSFRALSKIESVDIWRRYRIWRVAMCEIIKALKVGEDDLKLWFNTPHFRASWFPEDFSKQFLFQLRKIFKDYNREYTKESINRQQVGVLLKHGRALVKQLNSSIRMVASTSSGRLRPNRKLPDISRIDERGFSRGLRATGWEFLEEVPETIERLLKSLPTRETVSGPEFEREFKTWMRCQFQKHPSDESIYELIQDLNRIAFATLQEAKARQVSQMAADCKKRIDERKIFHLNDDLKVLWISVTIFTNAALHFCKLLNPAFSEQDFKERIKALCIYSVGLARLGRFYEAHRRLNEANALILKTSSSSHSVLTGILQLRRAETYLLESILVGEMLQTNSEHWNGTFDRKHLVERYHLKMDGSGMIGAIPAVVPNLDSGFASSGEQVGRSEFELFQIARLNDAWLCLENAERLIGGKLHSSHWWGRLCILKLRCIASQPEQATYKTLINRWRKEPVSHIEDILNEGLVSSQNSAKFQLRLLHYALSAIQNLKLSEKALVEKIVHVFNGMEPAADTKEYFDNFSGMLNRR